MTNRYEMEHVPPRDTILFFGSIKIIKIRIMVLILDGNS